MHLAKTNRLRANGQIERMNRTIEDATAKRRRCDSRDQGRRHLDIARTFALIGAAARGTPLPQDALAP
jgi:hypothetical protein